MKPLKGKVNSSQYQGTLKKSKCNLCNKDVSNLNREQQDDHARKCQKQQRFD